jgi:hypothetical protein|tara:strand:- start:80 stop:373 length:294 start_codon:yes stop_codon:yes gene_type:complete
MKKQINNTIIDMTPAEISAREEHEREMNDAKFGKRLAGFRIKRNILLQECDWTDLPNAPLTDEKKQEWLDYRQSLRDATEGLTTVNEINSYEFPTKP